MVIVYYLLYQVWREKRERERRRRMMEKVRKPEARPYGEKRPKREEEEKDYFRLEDYHYSNI